MIQHFTGRGTPALLLGGLAISLALGVGIFAVVSTPTHSVPQPDPEVGDGRVPDFYQWKSAVPATTGKLLRSEPLAERLSLANAAQSRLFLYTSQDAKSGRPTVVSGVLFVPRGKPPRGGWPLIAWAHGTTGLADVCAPSTYPRTERDSKYLNNWLAEGFAVVATDYQGLGTPGAHPYSNYVTLAYNVLDSARAVSRGHLQIANRVVLLGQSQGAATVVMAASKAASHAPEINILGTVATGVPNMSRPALESGTFLSHTDPGATVAYAMMATEAAQADTGVKLDELLTPDGIELASLFNSRCYFDVVGEAKRRMITPDMALQPNALKQIFGYSVEYRAYPTLKLGKPLFMGIGARDETTTTAGSKALVGQFCAAGTLVEAHLYAGMDHSGGVNASFPDARAFVQKLLAGRSIAPICDPQVNA